MRVDFLDQMYYGNYRFTVELDTGSETGYNQLTVWVAEKVDIDSVSLAKFTLDQLFCALREPQQSHLRTQLEEEKAACQKSFEEEIAILLHPFQTATEKKGQKLPGSIKQRAHDQRKQMKRAVRQLEREFARQELVTLDRQCFDHDILQAESQVFGENRFLRDFYFHEANERYIDNFCRKFALDALYRQKVLARETRWAERNALFVRNLRTVLGEGTFVLDDRAYEHKAHNFFCWIDTHVEEILALPDYLYLKGIDSAFQPNAQELDPFIRPAVELLNQIPGVTTQFSCQGISGKVRFQEYDLLVVSPHEEHAYVSFSSLEQSAYDAMVALLPEFSSITNFRIPCNFALQSVLRSTGDNLRFREELVALARRVVDKVNEKRICANLEDSEENDRLYSTDNRRRE